MHQTRLESLVETCCNIAIGFVMSLVFWVYVIIPLFHLESVTMGQNLQITMLFTGLAVVRGYLVRRFFNAGLHRFSRNAALWVKEKMTSKS